MVLRRRARIRRALYAAPRWLYKARLGFLLGERFIAIEHEGRNTGTTYLTPLEVIYRDRSADEYFVIPARGERSDWFRNVSKYPATAVYSGSRKRQVSQRVVDIDEAIAVMKIYEQDHPEAAVAMLDLAGVGGEPTTLAWRSAMDHLPMVAFTPK
jgi:deazaflavin-dependent oxidoreductase (nitroreductase family)